MCYGWQESPENHKRGHIVSDRADDWFGYGNSKFDEETE
jgi:hypothetical protein